MLRLRRRAAGRRGQAYHAPENRNRRATRSVVAGSLLFVAAKVVAAQARLMYRSSPNGNR